MGFSCNVGGMDRALRIIVGLGIVSLACPFYPLLKISTCKKN